MSAGVEEKRLVIEIIATLVNIKHTMAELILKPAGVPIEIYKPIFQKRDDQTGKPLSKRQMAPLILDALEAREECAEVIRAIISIGANWSAFNLAKDEFIARATVQKARELLGEVEVLGEYECP